MAIGDLTLLGPSTRSATRISAWLKTKNVGTKYLELPAIFIAMGAKYGVRGDIALNIFHHNQ